MIDKSHMKLEIIMITTLTVLMKSTVIYNKDLTCVFVYMQLYMYNNMTCGRFIMIIHILNYNHFHLSINYFSALNRAKWYL